MRTTTQYEQTEQAARDVGLCLVKYLPATPPQPAEIAFCEQGTTDVQWCTASEFGELLAVRRRERGALREREALAEKRRAQLRALPKPGRQPGG